MNARNAADTTAANVDEIDALTAPQERKEMLGM